MKSCKNKIKSIVISVLLTTEVLCNILYPLNAYALSTQLNNNIINSSNLAENYLKHKDSSVWYFLTKMRTKEVSEEEQSTWISKVQSDFKKISSMSATNIAKDIMVLSSLKIDSSNYKIEDTGEIINALSYMMDKCTSPTSVWVTPYVLMALNSYNFANKPVSDVCSEEDIVSAYVNSQLEDGTWKGTWGADGHGIVMAGLSYYKEREDVKKVLDKAAEYAINTMPSESVWGENSCSSACMILGLSSSGYDLEADTRFTSSEGINSLDALLNYQILDSGDNYGAFYWKYNSLSGSLLLSTEQSWYGLIQAIGGGNHKLFDFKDAWTIDSVTIENLDINPDKLSIDSSTNTLSWNSINDASTYNIYLDSDFINTTSNLNISIDNLSTIKDDSKIEIVALTSDKQYISKYVIYGSDIKAADKNDEQDQSSSTSGNSSTSYTTTDSHNITYTNSPSITYSPYYIGSVGDNSTIINMGSIYGNAQGTTVTSTYTVTDSNGKTTTTTTTVGQAVDK